MSIGRRVAAKPTVLNQSTTAEQRPYALFRYHLAPGHPFGRRTIADELKWHKFGSHDVYTTISDWHVTGPFMRLTKLPGVNPDLKEIEKELHIVILSFDRMTEDQCQKTVNEAHSEMTRQTRIGGCKFICIALLVVLFFIVFG